MLAISGKILLSILTRNPFFLSRLFKHLLQRHIFIFQLYYPSHQLIFLLLKLKQNLLLRPLSPNLLQSFNLIPKLFIFQLQMRFLHFHIPNHRIQPTNLILQFPIRTHQISNHFHRILQFFTQKLRGQIIKLAIIQRYKIHRISRRSMSRHKGPSISIAGVSYSITLSSYKRPLSS